MQKEKDKQKAPQRKTKKRTGVLAIMKKKMMEKSLLKILKKIKKNKYRLLANNKRQINQLKNRYDKKLQKYFSLCNSNNLDKHESIKPINEETLTKTFDVEYAKRIAKEKTENYFKLKRLFGKQKYGDNEYYKFLYYKNLLDVTKKICEKNGWLSREYWSEHKVPMNSIMRNFVKAAKNFSNIKRFYWKRFFDERRAKVQ